MKYQLSINIGKSADRNSASTKAVKDCAFLFSREGYQDNNLYYSEKTKSPIRYLLIFKELIKLFLALDKNAIVGIQYPMLNNVFKYFIKIARLRKVKFFCIIHDIESLRLGGQDKELVKRELENLNYYDYLIVHNSAMLAWLKENGVTREMVPLGVFDYLLTELPGRTFSRQFNRTIVFAGNLAKSNFIYSLGNINSWKFNVYGPNYVENKGASLNVKWKGQFAPDQVVYELDGDFGLIWDGDQINECDPILGNYLKYNNPHKFSLYLAAGLPVIAPKSSAIGTMIKDLGLGILVDDLHELDQLQVSEVEYKILKANCERIGKEIAKGSYFLNALNVVEKSLLEEGNLRVG